jgi:hypothetical protein
VFTVRLILKHDISSVQWITWQQHNLHRYHQTPLLRITRHHRPPGKK